MTNLEELKQQRTFYIKQYRNCRALAGQTIQEFVAMRKGFGSKYKELDRQIKKIQRLQRKESA